MSVLQLCRRLLSFQFIKGDSDIIVEDDMEISPEVVRELLASTLRILSKAQRGPRNIVKRGMIKSSPINVILSPPPPCRPVTDEEEISEEAAEQGNGSGRRAIYTSAHGLARNPYTGLIHHVQYPVVYPTYPTYPSVYG